MKRKRIIQIVLVLAAVAVTWACSDSFLDVQPQGAISEDAVSDRIGTEAALVGAYSMLDGYNLNDVNSWPATPSNWIMGSVPSDDAYKGSEQGDNAEITELELYQWSAGNSLLDQKWVPLYEGVVRSNKTLQLLAVAPDISDADRARIEGEARFLRAYYHFELYKVWGNVPYYFEDDPDFKKSNEGVDPLADAIADLEAAVDLLPDAQAEAGRIDKMGARAFLGKLYMYDNNYSSAKTQLDMVVDNVSLAPCLRDLFQYSTENHESALFSVQMSVSSNAQARNSGWLDQLAMPQGGGYGCCGFHQPSQNLVNAYKVDANGLPLLDTFNDTDLDAITTAVPVDPRIDLTIGRDDVPYWERGLHSPTWIRSRDYSGPYSPKKFQSYADEDANTPTGGWNGPANNGTNVPVIRLADAILLLAEAEVELGDLDRAEELVNMIRVRAGNCAQGEWLDGDGEPLKGSEVITNDIDDPAITWANYEVQPYPDGTFETQGAEYARKAVRMERRLELALEGHRFFDLQRWGIAAEVLNEFTADVERGYYDAAATFEDRHRWYPIPTIQIELSRVNGEAQLQQNTGW